MLKFRTDLHSSRAGQLLRRVLRRLPTPARRGLLGAFWRQGFDHGPQFGGNVTAILTRRLYHKTAQQLLDEAADAAPGGAPFRADTLSRIQV